MFPSFDNQEELFDVVDEQDQLIGKATRGQVHQQKDLIHRSIGVAIFNKKGEIFLQQRSIQKDTDSLKWTISCSGHVGLGDNYEETAHRELKEELGIDLSIKEVVKFLCYAPSETEMVTLFKATSNGPFKLSQTEILTGSFFSKKELKKRIKTGKIELSFMGMKAMEKLGWR